MTPDSYPSLFWAYNSVWIVLAVYTLWLGARLTHIERSLGKKGGSHRDEHARKD
jgi:CcmD family protein